MPEPSGAPSRWRAQLQVGIAVKIALWAALLGAITAGSVSYFMYRGSVDILVERQQQSLAASVNLAAARISTRFDTAERDVIFLVKTPAVDGLVRSIANGGVDPVDGSTAPVLRNRVATLFSALLEARPGYFQARFLDSSGREVVRVDRTADGKVTATPEAQLQDKGDRPYFAATAKLGGGSVYLSDIESNQENGVPGAPARPTARAATPLYDPSGRFIGIVILNLELSSLFDAVSQILGPGTESHLADESGRYLENAARGGTLSLADDASRRLQGDYPELGSLIGGTDPSASGIVTRPSGTYLAFGQRINFDPANPARFLVLAALVSNDELLARTGRLRDNAVLIALAVVLAAVVFAVFLSRLIVGPLRTMTAAAARIAEGRRDIDISDLAARHDETGEFARAVSAMAKEIGEREDRLTAQTGELTRSNQELAQFAYVASHDLQEPLRMVASYLELLSGRYADKLDSEAQEFIGFAVDGATRMKRLINDLLGYSRAGNSPLKRETVDAREVVSAALAALALSIEETHAEIRVAKLPKINVDAVQFSRVFQNLIENAIKYRSSAPPLIDITAERAGRGWRFAVADNGIGIDPAFKDKIFEIFKRLHGRERYSGTGIGLAVSKLVVERHGGRIWVEPGKSGGSVFYFTLPDPKAA